MVNLPGLLAKAIPAVRAARAAWVSSKADPIAELQQQMDTLTAEMENKHEPDPEGWEPCPGMNRSGICYRHLPVAGHIAGQDGGWWHVKGSSPAKKEKP